MANYIHVPPGSPEVPKLDIALSDVDGPGCRDGALQLLRRLRPQWSPEEVTLQASCLTDGDAVPWRQHINRVGVCFKVPVMILQDRLSSVSILYVWLKHDHAGPQYSAVE